MKRIVAILMLLVVVALPHEVDAQYNRNYIYWMGQQKMVNNNYHDAIDILNVLLRHDAKDFDAYFLRGIAKYNLDDLLGADADFSKAVELNPVFTGAYYYRAITRSRLGNYDDALNDFQQAIELRPDLSDPYYSRGVTRLLNQQFEAAIDDFDKFIRYEKRHVAAYINRGISYLNLKDTTKAYENFELAIRTNREEPEAYNRRGSLYLAEERFEEAYADFDKATQCDSTFLPAFFNRALVNNYLNRPMRSIEDLNRVIELDSTSAIGYFNRALIRSEIGDLNRALDDFNRVAELAPDNVLVYFNRALLHTDLGDIKAAIDDYTHAIELYPDFANAYLNRSILRRSQRDVRGAESDERTARRKIAEHRSRLSSTSSSSSIYADTTERFDKLLSLESKLVERNFERIGSTATNSNELTLIPMFRFTLLKEDSVKIDRRAMRLNTQRVRDFKEQVNNPLLKLDCRTCNIEPDSLLIIGKSIEQSVAPSGDDRWLTLFEQGVCLALIKQYTSAVNTLSEAIQLNPTNPFLYLNRATTRAEMIDFISSMDDSYHNVSFDSDPAKRLINTKRTYSYDEAIEDMNKVIKLYPDFAEGYYNRANLLAISGKLPEAYDDYTRAIELDAELGEAYYNRGLVQIYMKDTRKGCMDLSKAGELGIDSAYDLLREFRIAEY